MRKVAFIVMLILFIVIDVYTLWLMSPDFLFPKRSIYVTNQDDYIVERVKEYFRIEYDISKIVYQQGFPDGYSLDIYDVAGEKHEEFDDTFNVAESDKIQQYFLNLKPDSPKHLRLFEAELIIEFFVIALIIMVSCICLYERTLLSLYIFCTGSPFYFLIFLLYNFNSSMSMFFRKFFQIKLALRQCSGVFSP